MFMIDSMSSNNRLIDKKKSTMDNSMRKEISKTEQEERAQNSEQLEKIQVLLKENMKLWEQKKELEYTTWDLSYEMDQTRDNINTFHQDVLRSQKVSYTHNN